MVHSRFLDLLDFVEDQDGKDEEVDVDIALAWCPDSKAIRLLNSGCDKLHGPLNWNAQCSIELQCAVDSLNKDELCELEFSVSVADPTLPDCPLVACSIGFTELTGYHLQEIVGRNCRLLLNGVPEELIDDEVRSQCRSYCQSAKHGREYDGLSEVLPQGLSKSWFSLPKGELICIQTNCNKSGELFKNMFYLKQVELDDSHYIVALQAGIPDECEDWSAKHILQRKCNATWQKLDANMSTIVEALSSQFWYQAPMRRASNCNFPADES